MAKITPPTLAYPLDGRHAYRPSYPGFDAFINEEHRGIHEFNKAFSGWLDPGDSFKLYELAFHSGQVILEIGVFAGRSAATELRGALAAARSRDLPPPQYFGVDVDPGFMTRTRDNLSLAGVAEHALLYHGTFGHFVNDIDIVPTMVMVDGDHSYAGVWTDLNLLRRILVPGTPVMCHDYGGIPGVKMGVDEWIASGEYEAMGQFAGSALLRFKGTSARSVPLEGRGLSPEIFETLKDQLFERCSRMPRPMARGGMHTPSRDLTAIARPERTARTSWPFASTESPLPPTLPSGRPWPKISVVTPSFNQGAYIEETILSVLNQGYPNLEYIVIDGGSTDGTSAILDRYRHRLDHVESEHDRGQSHAINKGFAKARGTILTWLNSDDQLAPGALAAAAVAFEATGADMVAGLAEIYREGVLTQKHLTACDDGPLPLDELLDLERGWMAGKFFYQPEVLFTRAIFDKAGGQVDESLFFSMDYDLWLRLAHAGARLSVIGTPIARFRAHELQKTASTEGGGFRAELPKARQAFLDRTGHAPTPMKPHPIKPRLKVAMVNDLGYAYGAGIAHKRMAEALALGGHEVVSVSAGTAETGIEAPAISTEDVIAKVEAHSPDLVIIGNVHGTGLDQAGLPLLSRLASTFKAAFVLHDQWLLTGRCAYTGACELYRASQGGCGPQCSCAPSNLQVPSDQLARRWQSKRDVVSSSPELALWANSTWMRDNARAALTPLQTDRVRAIGFGLDLEVYRPIDRREARRALNLPVDRLIILTSASSLSDPRKGLSHLARALEILSLPDALVIGKGWFPAGQEPPIPGMKAMGYMGEPSQQALLYAAADIFVGPSLEEAFGQVFIEAAACGTSSVGYPVGGVPEAIAHGLSGVIADDASPEALARAIEFLVIDPQRRERMRATASAWARGAWSQASSYRRMYVALRAMAESRGWAIPNKIDLALSPCPAPAPALARAIRPSWRAVSGFEAWEGPYPEQGLPRCRWAHGPVAKLVFDAETPGRSVLAIAIRTYQAGQRVRVLVNGLPVGERDVPVSQGRSESLLSFHCTLEAGANSIEIHSWQWAPGPRPMAVLVSSITALPTGGRASPRTSPQVQTHIEPKSTTAAAH